MKPELESAWERTCSRRGWIWTIVLLPLSFFYGAASWMLRRGRPRRLAARVISVGNLSVGGSGKTPLVLALGTEAARRGWKPAVLARGYGCDEVLLYEQAGLPAFLGADRLDAAGQALAEGHDLLLLDDGFQRRHQMARDLDILMVDFRRLELESHMLPAGRLREGLAAAAEAHAVLVTHAPADWNAEALRLALPGPYRGLRVFRADHQAVRLRRLDGARRPLTWLKGRRVTAVSGIGQPAAFEDMLAGLGALVRPRRFPDHHEFRAADLADLEGAVVCTSKDAVKLAGLDLSGRREFWVLDIVLKIDPAKAFAKMVFP